MRVLWTSWALFLPWMCWSAASLPAQQVSPATPDASAVQACPMRFSVNAAGKLYEDSGGATMRISQHTFEQVLHSGCKRTGPPTSLTLAASPAASFHDVQRWLEIMQKNAPAGMEVRLLDAGKPRRVPAKP